MKSSKCLMLGGLAAIAVGGVATIVSKLKTPKPDGTAEQLMGYADTDISGFTPDQVDTFMNGMTKAFSDYSNGTDARLLSVDAYSTLNRKAMSKYNEAIRMRANAIIKSGTSS